MQRFQHDHQRLNARGAENPRDQCTQQLLALLIGWNHDRRIFGRHRHPKHPRDDRHGLFEIHARDLH